MSESRPPVYVTDLSSACLASERAASRWSE
jgi:hypothetical protein